MTTNTVTAEPLSPSTPRLYTVRDFCARHGWASMGGIRALIFNAETNGFCRCIRRIGRRVLLDEGQVFAWIESNPNERRA